MLNGQMAAGAKSRAEYMRNYRRMAVPQIQRKAERDGMREGIDACVKFLREKVRGRALTGFQAAVIIERAMIDAELPEVAARRRFIDSLQGPDPQPADTSVSNGSVDAVEVRSRPRETAPRRVSSRS